MTAPGPKPKPAYLTIRPDALTHLTMFVSPGLLVDLDDTGRVVGVERIGGPVDAAALADVLRAVPFRNALTDVPS